MAKWRSLFEKLWCHPWHLMWVGLAYVPFLGSLSVPLTGDQKLYLSTAMEMREHGSWLHPIFLGQNSYYKPPLQYWATLAGWKLLGVNLWGALLPSVLCVLITAWLLGEIARLLGLRSGTIGAGLWFAAALGTMTFGVTAQMEIYLCLLYGVAWWAALHFLSVPKEARQQKQRWYWLYLAFVAAGLLSLVKSPLYSAFWVLGFLSYLVISGEWELFLARRFYGALAAGIVAGAAWYVAVLLTDGERFWAEYLVRETWQKNVGNQSTIVGFWVAILYFCFPFTLLLFPAVRVLWRGRRHWPALLSFLVCWSWPAAVFFTFYPYRTRPYLFLLVPALALLVEFGQHRAVRSSGFRGVLRITGGIFALVIFVLTLVIWRAELIPAWIAAAFAAVGVIAVWVAIDGRIRGLALCGLASVLLFRGAAVSLGMQDSEGLRVAVNSHPGVPLAMLDENKNIWHEAGLLSLGIEKRIERLDTLEAVADFLHAGGMVALTDEQAAGSMRAIQAILLGRGDLRDLQELQWSRWKTRTRFPYAEVIMKGKNGIPDFDERTHRIFKIVMLADKVS